MTACWRHSECMQTVGREMTNADQDAIAFITHALVEDKL
jgi:hypothetical protein